MGTCGKHFPGHGYVIPDSHVDLPVDDRAFADMQSDLVPYRELPLDGVMAAHVIYQCMDCNTAVFSNKWIDFLRNDIKFDGVVFTDDLSMAGAGIVGDMTARVQAAYAAGCDMLLVCNSPESVAQVLANWQPEIDPLRQARVARLSQVADRPDWPNLIAMPRYQLALKTIAELLPAA